MQYLTKLKNRLILINDRYYIGVFLVLIVIYLLYTVFHPPDKAALALYHINKTQAEIIIYSFVVPLCLIWLVGLYGALKLKGYVHMIRKSPDGDALSLVSVGLLLLVLSQPLISDVNILIAEIAIHHSSWLPTMTIINNYFDLLLMALAFVLIAVGAESLTRLVKVQIGSLERRLWVLGFITLSTFYSYFLISQPLHSKLARRAYYLDPWLLVLTIAIPYLYFWYRGFGGAYGLYTYQKKVKGPVYKGSLSYIAGGITAVVVSSIAVRLITTISYKLSRFSLTPILFIIYGLLLLIGIGYILIAYGAKKLRKIEEV